LAQAIRLEGIIVHHAVRGGTPADSLLRTMSETPCDLVVMGTHGRRGLSHLVNGSVAEAVLRRAPCPVLTVKSPKFAPGHRRIVSKALSKDDASSTAGRYPGTTTVRSYAMIGKEYVPMNIVLAVDGSKHGRWSMQWVPRLPLVVSPKVIAVHAVDLAALKAPFVAQSIIAGNQPYLRAEVNRLEQQATRVSSEIRDFLASARIPGRVIVERGTPAPSILKHARRGDLIVLGSRGLTGLDRFMLGSVSQYVTFHAPTSVLVVKQPPRVIRRIVFATDGSKSSNKALRFLMENIRAENLDIVVVHVMPFLRYPELKEAGQALVDRDAERLVKAGYEVSGTVKLGHPADEVIKMADRHKADLMVTGAKGLGAIARFFLGSVSTKLIQHSSCSMLVVR
jgi:nucleotide-binding universal stress UspA family protein